jgi:hypothetical protein
MGAFPVDGSVVSLSCAQEEWGSNVAIGEVGSIAEGSLEHCLLVVAWEWENIVAFKSIVARKARLCDKQH